MIVGGHARIGGPDATQRRVHDPRVIRHGGPGGAAAGARRSGVRGDAPVDGPADVALLVADHHVLVGNAHGGGERERLGDRGGALERHETQVGRRRVLRQPGAEPTAVLRLIGAQQHARGRGLHLHHDRRLTVHPDLLAHHRQRHRARGRRQLVLPHRGARHAADIQPGAVTVGEAPGDVSVRPGDQQRRSGQRDAVQVEGLCGAGGDPQAGVIPQRRDPQPEVHVVGDERGAGRGQAARHRPAVAARGRLARDAPGHGRRSAAVAHIQHLCGRHRSLRRAHRALRRRHGRIPAGSGRVQEAEAALPARAALRASEPRVDLLAQDLAPQAVRLQIPPHGVLDEDRVLRAPRERGCAQHPVLPRASGKVCESGVHAARVGLEQRALGGGCLREHLAGDRAKPEQAGPAVLLEGRAAEQLRQLPGGEPPREVHLEIAVLRVHETGGVREVGAVGGLDGGHAA